MTREQMRTALSAAVEPRRRRTRVRPAAKKPIPWKLPLGLLVGFTVTTLLVLTLQSSSASRASAHDALRDRWRACFHERYRDEPAKCDRAFEANLQEMGPKRMAEFLENMEYLTGEPGRSPERVKELNEKARRIGPIKTYKDWEGGIGSEKWDGN